MKRFTKVGARVGVLAAVGALAAACGSSATSSSPQQKPASSSVAGVYGKVPAAATGAQHAGTIKVAQPPGAKPTWILPLVNAANNSVFTVLLFDYQMWRPLYWTQVGYTPKINPSLSLASTPQVSNGDKTFTIHLKSNYKWSDGTPVTSKDVVFWFDILKAAVKANAANWADYTPKIGLPDQVASVTAPNATTVVFNLKSPINPTFLIENQLSAIQPMPAQSWARASASGPLLDYTVPANAAKIYSYLNKASSSLGTYASNPMWKVVDGPYQLSSYNSATGAFTMTPNAKYSGPAAKKISTYQSLPYTSDTAEYNAVRAGTLDIGYVPLTDLPQIGTVKSKGYNVFGYPDFGWLYVTYNFKDTTGHFNSIIKQLYIRQALAHLQDQQGVIKAFFNGAAAPAFGPLPSLPKSPYAPANALSNPYPYSVSAATSLLSSHGWKINAGGTDVCTKPGTAATECGAGIPAGTKLAWNLIYTTSPANIGSQVTAFTSQAKKAGIDITLKSSNFNYMVQNYNDPAAPKNANKWAMEDFGGFTNSTYPTTFSVFNCQGSNNLGGYCDPHADTLIHDSVYGSNPNAVQAEAQYLTQQQPGLFQPNPSAAMESGNVLVWKTNLSGPPDAFAEITQWFINPEQMYFTK